MLERYRVVVGLALLVAVAASAQEGAGDDVVLKRGTQHHERRDRAVGLVAVEAATADRPARARVSVSAGACSFLATVAAGERLRLGGAVLEVVAVEPPHVRFRRHGGGDAADPLRAAPAPQEGRLALAPQAIYTLPDGRTLGVGNVRRDGEGGAPVLTLTLFPAGFGDDPTRGYDLHVDAAAGADLAGAHGRVRVVRVEAARDDAPAAVEVELAPR